MESVWLIFVVLVLLLIIAQINLKLRVSYDIIKNKGIIKFSVFTISIFKIALSIESGHIKIVDKKGNVTLIPLDFKNETFQDYADFNIILFRKIHFKKTSIFVNFGVEGNAFLTSMVCASILTIVGILASIVNNKSGQINFSNRVYPNYKKNRLNVLFRASISISIYDYLWCLMENLFRRRSNING